MNMKSRLTLPYDSVMNSWGAVFRFWSCIITWLIGLTDGKLVKFNIWKMPLGYNIFLKLTRVFQLCYLSSSMILVKNPALAIELQSLPFLIMFTMLHVGYTYLLWGLNGSLDCLCPLWLARVITLLSRPITHQASFTVIDWTSSLRPASRGPIPWSIRLSGFMMIIWQFQLIKKKMWVIRFCLIVSHA